MSDSQTNLSSNDQVLPDDVKQRVRDALAKMAEQPNFKRRFAQRKMLAEVSKTLAGEYDGRNILCVEGPTGTGKSLGYLLAAIPTAQYRQNALIISSATVALQEQLIDKDLPEVLSQSGLEFNWALAKGRGRYVCDRNLAKLNGQKSPDQAQQDHLGFADAQPMLHDDAVWQAKPSQKDLATVQQMQKARDDDSWNGDLDAWPGEISSLVRSHITTDAAGCSRKHCPFASRCAFYKARDKMREADVIVANHALVMSDLMLGGGVLLPSPEDSIYIFDEAHHLPRVAVDHGAAQTTLKGAQKWLEGLPKLPQKAAGQMADAKQRAAVLDLAPSLTDAVGGLVERLDDVYRALGQSHPAAIISAAQLERMPRYAQQALPIWRFENGVMPDNLRLLFEQAADAAAPVSKAAAKLQQKIQKALDDKQGSPGLANEFANARWLAMRAQDMVNSLSLLALAEQENVHPPKARWIEALDEKDDYLCNASPTTAAYLLETLLWSRCAGAILTSATLAALGRFSRFFEQTGLSRKKGDQGLRLPSPFDYAKNATLHVPRFKNSAKNQQAHTQELIEQFNDGLIDLNEGTLVLFSSYKQMRAVEDGLKDALYNRVLMQGDAARHQLLTEHRQRIAKGQGSVLFGVASFSEGLDLPGEQCKHVIIAKLPFTVPDSPVEATYAEWLKANNRNAFMELSVPDASFRLVQACGRLLRAEDDTGRVTICDTRLTDTSYGQAMLAALPPFRRV